MSSTIDRIDAVQPDADASCRPRASERVWSVSQLGRNGNPPPYSYQRRLDLLGPCPPRKRTYRSDWLESVSDAQRKGKFPLTTVGMADVLAARSNAHGNDVDNVTEKRLGELMHKRSGECYSAKFASDRLDELRAEGFLEWEHGTEAQRWDEDRRQQLGGRWQGTCTYRLVIPAEYVAALAERRSNTATRTRERLAADKPGRVTSSSPAPNRRSQVREFGAGIARTATTLDEGIAQIGEQYSGELYEVAYYEFVEVWRRVRDGP